MTRIQVKYYDRVRITQYNSVLTVIDSLNPKREKGQFANTLKLFNPKFLNFAA